MRRHIALLALCSIFAAASASAQVTLGVVAGATMSSASTTGTTGYTLSSLAGFVGGVSVTAKLARNLWLAPEAVFIMKGVKEGLVATPAITASTRADYLEVPFLLRVAAGSGNLRPFVTAGPEMAFKVSCTITVAGTGTFDGTSDCNQPGNSTSGITSTDFGMVIGVGVEGRRTSVSVRYDIGLVNIARDPTVGAPTAQNRAFMAVVGFAI